MDNKYNSRVSYTVLIPAKTAKAITYPLVEKAHSSNELRDVVMDGGKLVNIFGMAKPYQLLPLEVLDGLVHERENSFVYRTPLGLMPRQSDLVTIFGKSVRTIERWVADKDNPQYTKLREPTRKQKIEAADNVNDFYLERFKPSNNCPVYSKLDDECFARGDWLVSCGSDSSNPYPIVYSHKGEDLTESLVTFPLEINSNSILA